MPPLDDGTSLGYWIRRRRKALDLTQAQLAQQVGCAVATIKKIEGDERRPSRQMAERLADCLAIPPEERAAFLRVARAELSRCRLATIPRVDAPVYPSPAVADRSTSPNRQLHKLPHRLTSLIGREQAVAALQRLVKSHRLVTLTGVGGVGKSSLALAVANTLAFPDGVWLLELAPITEAGLVTRLLADLFQLPEFPGPTPLEAVISYLQHKELLLIVDNCEHLIATCAELVDRLLQAAATLHIVATSREALNVAGEREWPVLPLPTPNRAKTAGSAWRLSQLQAFAAAQLFIERAQAVNAELSFTDQDAPLIAHICHQLDGIPLALELAAARCKSFTLQEIVARLQDRFTLLSAGRRTALLRHQTLRATIDWSYDLLNPAEAALFRSLAVFAGGWTVAAAEQVADQSQGHPPTFELLHQLVNKSLVVVDQRSETTYYSMLETIREYAREKLVEQGEVVTVSDRHAAYFLQLAEQSRPLLYSAQQNVYYQRLILEQNNFRAAFHWWRANNDYAEVARLSAALCWFWWKHGDIREEAHWSEWALSEMDRHRAPTLGPMRAKALYAVAFGAECLGDWARARRLYEEYLQLESQPSSFIDFYEVLGELAAVFRLEGDSQQAKILEEHRLVLSHEYAFPNGVADALMQLGKHALSQGDVAQASQLLQESLTLRKAGGTVTGVAHTQAMLGVVACEQGNFAQALLLFQEVLDLCRTLDDKHGLGWTYSDLGVVAQLQQLYKQANQYQHDALTLARELGYQHMVGFVLGRLGNLALLQDDLERARAYYAESLTICRQLNMKEHLAVGLEGLAGVAALSGHSLQAAHLLGTAEACWQEIGRVRSIEQRAIYEQTVAVTRTALGEAQFDVACITGRTIALNDAIIQVLGIPERSSA